MKVDDPFRKVSQRRYLIFPLCLELSEMARLIFLRTMMQPGRALAVLTWGTNTGNDLELDATAISLLRSQKYQVQCYKGASYQDEDCQVFLRRESSVS